MIKVFFGALIVFIIVGIFGFMAYDYSKNNAAVAELRDSSTGFTPSVATSTPVETKAYTNDVDKYSIEVPLTATIEANNQVTTVREPEGSESSIKAHIAVEKGGKQDLYDTYDQFVLGSVKAICAQESPVEKTYCEQMTQAQPFTSKNGVEGLVFYVNRIRYVTNTKDERRDVFGPFFVFTIPVPSPGQFSALFIYPPAEVSATAVDSLYIRALAQSLQFK